ncbi:ComF family protein [Rarobacter faecitabidus]
MIRRALAELARLVVPIRCAGCGRYDDPWCAECRSDWQARGFRCEHLAGRLDQLDGKTVLPVWAIVPYEGPHRRAIVAAKDGGRRDLHARFARSASALALAHTKQILAPGRGGRIAVVPVPSSATAVRARGANLTATIAHGVATALGARYLDCLVARSVKRDQVGLGQAGRSLNAARSVRISRLRPPRGPARVVLVDDIVTSGATLRACARVLSRAGFEVVAALTLASTRPPGTLVTAMSRESG